MDDVVEEFIEKYDSDQDLSFIKLDYHGSIDLNNEFRYLVSLKIKEINYKVEVELLRDLFIAHCEYSAKAWVCYRYLGEIGQALIEKSKTKYVLDYLHFSQYYFDCLLASGQVKWSEELVLEIREYLEKIKINEDDKTILHDIEFGLSRRFGEHHIKTPSLIKKMKKTKAKYDRIKRKKKKEM